MDEQKVNPGIIALIRKEYAHLIKRDSIFLGRAIMSVDIGTCQYK